METIQKRKKITRGAVLALMIFALVLLIVLGTGLLSQSAVGGIEVAREINSAKAFWAAEAGLEKAVYVLRYHHDMVSESLFSETDQLLQDSQCTYNSNVSLDNNKFKVVSTGFTHGGHKKTVVCELNGDPTVGHWTFDQPETDRESAYDISGRDNHGEFVNMSDSSWLEDQGRGEGNYVMAFDGENDYIDTQMGGAPDEYGDVITLSLWTKLNEPEGTAIGQGPIIAEVDDNYKVIWDITYDFQWDADLGQGIIEYQFAVRINNQGRFMTLDKDNSVAAIVQIDTSDTKNSSFDIFGWHHIAVIYNDDYMQSGVRSPLLMIVVDANPSYQGFANLAAGDSWLGHDSEGNKEQDNAFVIGGREASPSIDKDKVITVDGMLDDIRIYDQALSQDNIEKLANDEEPALLAPGDALERFNWSIVQ